MSLPSPASVREPIDILEGDANNGDLHRFFCNSAGDRTSEILRALSAIGKQRTRTIVEGACAKFPGGRPPTDRFARQEVLWTIAPQCDEFETDAAAFHEYKDDLAALVGAHCGR